MATNKTTILAAIDCPYLTFGKAGLHHYYFEYTNGSAGIYMQRKSIHVRKLTQFPLDHWVNIGKESVGQMQITKGE